MSIADVIFIILFLALCGWMVISLFGKSKRDSRSQLANDYSQKSPYEKMLDEHTLDWNVRWERRQLVKRTAQLKEALRQGNQIAVTIQRSMIIHSKSVVSYLQHLFRS